MSVLLAAPDNPTLSRQSLDDKHPYDGLFCSEALYWKEYYHYPDVRFEWNDGYLEEKPASTYATGTVYRWLFSALYRYFKTYKIGEILTLSFGFRLALPHKTLIRRPDMAIVLYSNPIFILPHDNVYHGIYDLCVEAISDQTPEAVERDTVIKKREYEQIGVKEYYMLDATEKETAFYRLNGEGKYEPIKPIDGDIIQSEVLPGFQFRIADLYRQPDLVEMAFDKVYRQFMRLDLNPKATRLVSQQTQEARQQAEEARRQAEKEGQRVEEAESQLLAVRQEKERLAAKLRELGIELD